MNVFFGKKVSKKIIKIANKDRHNDDDDRTLFFFVFLFSKKKIITEPAIIHDWF
mgnify:CR=1 FL=1